MIRYFKDYNDNIIIAIFEVKLESEKIAKKISEITGYEFEEIKSDHYSDILEFSYDTLIINKSLISEDILTIMDYGVLVYIVDY